MDKKPAITKALADSTNSVIVSALCFFAATFGVGPVSYTHLQAGTGESGVCVMWSGNTGEGFKVSHKAWICSEAGNTI